MVLVKIKHAEHEVDWKVDPSIEGETHDTCPSCGTDVEPHDVVGIKNHHEGVLYCCDSSNGQGCGATWARTTRMGADHLRRAGKAPKWEVASSARGRQYFSVSMDAETYRRIFGHD